MFSHRSRHSSASRALALCLMVAQFTLFVATGLLHVHPMPAGTRDVASSSHHGQAALFKSTRLPALTRLHHSESSDCPICKVAASTVVSAAAAHPVALWVALVGQAPISSPVHRPGLLTGLSSARAPPTL
jgi:hypothetical protein